MKKKITKQYSVFIIPRHKASIRRFEVTPLLFKALTVLSVAFLAFVAASVSALIYYRNAFVATENVRLESAAYQRESSFLLSKLASLEDAVARTSRFAAKLESVLGRGGNRQTGEGPIEEEDWMPQASSMEEGYKPVDRKWHSPFKEPLKLAVKIDDLIAKAYDVEEHLNSVFVFEQDRLFFWASLPSIWPTHGWVTSDFGDRRSFKRVSGGRGGRWHEGIDIAGPYGTPVMASGDGLVTFAGYRPGYGKLIVIDHGNGISSVYAHCSAVFVEEGKKINRGMIIAAIGNTGRSTGPHLHYEIHVDGVPVDPLHYIVDNM